MRKWRFLRQTIGLASGVIALAGIPEAMQTWAMWLETLGAVFDMWAVRAGLAVVAFLLLANPQWWLPRVRRMFTPTPPDAQPGDVARPAPLAIDWQAAEDRFAAISGEVSAIWHEYDDGRVNCEVSLDGDDGGTMRMERFLIEARAVGRALQGRDVPRRFPKAEFTDPAHEWLNVVAARVTRSDFAGDSRSGDVHST